MNNENLVASFTTFANSKNIDRPTVIQMLDDVLRTLLKKKFGTDEGFHIVINPEKGDLQIWRYQKIVADDSEEAGMDGTITLSQARELASDFEVGEEVADEINLQMFGRRAIVQAMQLLTQRIQELERDDLYLRYKELEGELIYAEVYHLTPRMAILHDAEKNELILLKDQQIPNEKYRKGTPIHALIENVSNENHRLRIVLSRTSARFLEKTLENQIDEIAEGIVKIEKVVRRPGERSKVVVSTQDDRVDPVGACVGSGGQRIRNISRRELWNEQVDIIGNTDNEELFIRRALAPAQIQSIQYTGERITISLKPDQVPLAIGANGQNIDLAIQLIGKPIDIYRELMPGQETPLKELAVEVKDTVIKKLNEIGLETVDSVLKLPKEELQKRTGLPKEDMDALYELITNKYAVNTQPTQPV